MKKTSLSLLILLSALSQPAHAATDFVQGGRATIFDTQKQGLFHNNAFIIEKRGTNSASLGAFGSNVDSDTRLTRLAKLQTANYAVVNGFRYFKLEITRKSVSCRSKLTDTWGITPHLQGEVTLSNTNFNGATNAQELLNKDLPALSIDAPQAEKDAAFAGWRDTCYSKYPPQTIARDKAITGLTNVLADSAIRIIFH
ncbi:MAG: hypothetical protein M3O03_04945 [Pseudomonadota bacterium]|nr:hypothetical protein [Pseudomonadota bacterium]